MKCEEGETFGILTTYQCLFTVVLEFINRHTVQVCKSALHKDRDEAEGGGKVTAIQY